MRLSSPYARGFFWVLLGCIATSAWSHGIDMFAQVEGDQIVGTVSFAGGTPVRHGEVRAFAPDGTVLATTETDEAGKFALPAKFRVRYRLVGDGGEGHRGLFTIPESELSPRLPSYGEKANSVARKSVGVSTEESVKGLDEAALELIIARQLGPLREQLHKHEKRVQIRDVFGGIGYVFGVFGIYVLLKKKRAAGSDS